MSNADVIELEVGHGTGRPPAARFWFEGVLARTSRTQEVTLPHPVTLTVR